MKVVIKMKRIFNMKNITFVLSFALLMFVVINTSVLALGDGLNETILNDVTDENYNLNANVLKPVKSAYSTIYTVFQIIGMGGIVYMGVKYMYAGSDDKAQIKKTLIWVVVGVLFLFAAPSIIDFISGAAVNTLTP